MCAVCAHRIGDRAVCTYEREFGGLIHMLCHAIDLHINAKNRTKYLFLLLPLYRRLIRVMNPNDNNNNNHAHTHTQPISSQQFIFFLPLHTLLLLLILVLRAMMISIMHKCVQRKGTFYTRYFRGSNDNNKVIQSSYSTHSSIDTWKSMMSSFQF